MGTKEFLSMNGGIAIAVALGILFILFVLFAVYAYRKWQQNQQALKEISEGVNKLREGLIDASDALKETRKELGQVQDEVRQQDEDWKEHQKGMLRARHQVFIESMVNRLSEMQEEVKLADKRGILDDKETAFMSSQYNSAQAIVKSLLNN